MEHYFGVWGSIYAIAHIVGWSTVIGFIALIYVIILDEKEAS